MTKYQKTVDKIIEANPSIMELKFGCRIKDNDGIYFIWKIDGNTIYAVMNDIELLTTKEKLLNYEILGREITISDILKALENFYAVDGTGTLFKLKQVCDNEWIFECLNCRFDSNKPFHLQSQETKDFIHKLLFNK